MCQRLPLWSRAQALDRCPALAVNSSLLRLIIPHANDASKFRALVKTCLLLSVLLPLSGHSIEPDASVRVVEVLRTTNTWFGLPIELPHGPPEIIGVVIEIAPGSETGWHSHPAPSFAFVIAGTLEVRLASGAMKRFRSGEAFAEVIDTQHNGSVEKEREAELTQPDAGRQVAHQLTTTHLPRCWPRSKDLPSAYFFSPALVWRSRSSAPQGGSSIRPSPGGGKSGQEVRFAAEEATPDQNFAHRLRDFNNLPNTQFADIKAVPAIAKQRVSQRLSTAAAEGVEPAHSWDAL